MNKIFNPSAEALVVLDYLMFVIVVVVLVKNVLVAVLLVTAVVVPRAIVLVGRVFHCVVDSKVAFLHKDILGCFPIMTRSILILYIEK